ncbi:hypothetical protein BT96DRAFT_998947 [Gymnopus androsaceus JB14]|uniref:Uncharacterized protein n=1 Tax=Gymnopus androsaceus JB14 TaxID=1447944 RepID=A0A6A4H9D5_9AGAR|nr:hypothetical protein BT96DRAFT_998947 [Gymnopus androsaceus JB14]
MSTISSLSPAKLSSIYLRDFLKATFQFEAVLLRELVYSIGLTDSAHSDSYSSPRTHLMDFLTAALKFEAVLLTELPSTVIICLSCISQLLLSMAAKKYKTAQEKKEARREINARSYAKNWSKITKHRKQNRKSSVSKERKENNVEGHLSLKSPRNTATHKPNADPKKCGNSEKHSLPPSHARNTATHKPNADPKKRENSEKHSLPPSHVTPTHDNSNVIDEIEYLMDHGPARPKEPVTVSQLAFENVRAVFMNYKAVIGSDWTSGFFK